MSAAIDRIAQAVRKLNRGYDKYVHPSVMKGVNALGMGDKATPSVPPSLEGTVGQEWQYFARPDGGKAYFRRADPQDRSEYFKLLGKGSLLAAGLGGIGALASAAAERTVAPLSSKTSLTVPLTEREQQLLLSSHDLDNKRKKPKLGGVDGQEPPKKEYLPYSQWPGGKAIPPGNVAVTLDNKVFYQPTRGIAGTVLGKIPEYKLMGEVGDKGRDALLMGKKSPAPLPSNPVQPLFNTPWGMPLLATGLLGAGGLGWLGVKGYFDRSRKKKLIAEKEKARKKFLDALAAERETKLSSAIDGFVTACEEKFTIKEASSVDTFLGVLGTLGLLAGGVGFYNGLNSEPGSLRKLKALRKAREQQLAMQEEFEPQIVPDLSFLPALPKPQQQKQITYDV